MTDSSPRGEKKMPLGMGKDEGEKGSEREKEDGVGDGDDSGENGCTYNH